MPTRSAAKRANANARYIARRAAHPRSNAVRWIWDWDEDGAFTEVSARVFALHKTTYPIDVERAGDVNWSLVSELMNRVTKAPAKPSSRERYKALMPPPEYRPLAEHREPVAWT